MRNSHIKLLLFLLIISFIVCGNHIFGWSSMIENRESIALLEKQIEENLSLAILTYMVLTVVGSVVLALPGITFAVIAGLVFGPVLGTICCLLAATAGAMLAFLAGRFFLKESIRPVIMKNRHLKKWLFDQSGQNMVLVLMITRLVPVFPYNLQNFAYGITDIRFSVYSLFSLIFMLPGTAMYTIGAAGLADSQNRIAYITIAVVLAAVVMGISAYLRKRYVKEEEQNGSEEK